MRRYPEEAWERAMKVQDVILRAMAKKITWWQAAKILGISVRSMRRWRERCRQYGYDGVLDWQRAWGAESEAGSGGDRGSGAAGVAMQYADFNARPFHEKLVEEHGLHFIAFPSSAFLARRFPACALHGSSRLSFSWARASYGFHARGIGLLHSFGRLALSAILAERLHETFSLKTN